MSSTSDVAPVLDGETDLPIFTTDLRKAARRSESETSEWTDEKHERALFRYRRFFALARRGGPIAPTREIDMIWHLHMLAPVAYYRDCQRYLNRILDHDGGFGKTPEEAEELANVFFQTAERWEQAYGEPYVANACGQTKCWHDCQNRCWHACKQAYAAPELRAVT